ncbi:unnamed protein product [Rotaria magnacalcarata]|uniref:Uncharacterized protein n=1 Tax=Rotaria magnacalcarata TaxID=392030 RepID=A0A816PA04_9BILA|nr:unnamed protein product [Rotaria magnacalcarata]CAF1681468.1 unnamed protein product [Rotaria magnacalcarata]CAF2045706.1 unnamed protein product [Rotaria magnacalcarata]CAF2142571.1 unnamed protein product [Rotaria magnacalcarata]
MSSSCINRNESSYEDLEAKRQNNLEDNRRFLAALKINDIRDEIKEITSNRTETESNTSNRQQAEKKNLKPDAVRRGSRVRKNVVEIENLSSTEKKQKKKTITKKTDENKTHSQPKIKLHLPEHMLVRYQSTSKKVALHNPKAKFGDDLNETTLM